jgi:hypothetical protein
MFFLSFIFFSYKIREQECIPVSAQRLGEERKMPQVMYMHVSKCKK